jgi:RNA polymerase sigma factor for flagellar operon FliA
MFDSTEEELWHKFKKQGDLDARESLILKYTGVVKYAMDRLMMTPPSTVEYNDLYNCGILGLIHAVDRFDPSYGVKFQTYAIRRIRGEILDESKRMGWLPRPLYKKHLEIEKMFAELEKQHGHPPEEEEVASALFMEVGNDIIYLIDLLEDPDVDVTASVEKEELNKLIAQAIDRLPKQEKQVVALYYKECLTLKEIGNLLNVTESRISQIHTQAMVRIRSRLRTLGITNTTQ